MRAAAAAGVAGELVGALAVAGAVEDPELPGISIAELGILRGAETATDGRLVIRLTPTYSGCPAVELIEGEVRAALAAAGYADAVVERVLAPPWTTDWITAEGRRKLAEAGIAPPGPAAAGVPTPVALRVRCPWCGSADTEVISPFGSTACKALRRCRTCTEPFDHFKPL